MKKEIRGFNIVEHANDIAASMNSLKEEIVELQEENEVLRETIASMDRQMSEKNATIKYYEDRFIPYNHHFMDPEKAKDTKFHIKITKTYVTPGDYISLPFLHVIDGDNHYFKSTAEYKNFVRELIENDRYYIEFRPLVHKSECVDIENVIGIVKSFDSFGITFKVASLLTPFAEKFLKEVTLEEMKNRCYIAHRMITTGSGACKRIISCYVMDRGPEYLHLEK